jgi:hypothetical protein
MPVLANARHESFAVNRASGQRQVDAYVNAGFEASPSSASQLERRPEVGARIQELIQERVTERRRVDEDSDDSISDIDKAWVLRMLKQNVKDAQSAGQINAANKALDMIMNLVGLNPKKPSVDHDLDEDKAAGPRDDTMSAALDKLEQLTQRLPADLSPIYPSRVCPRPRTKA